MKLTDYANAINKDLKMTYYANQESPWRISIDGLEIMDEGLLVSRFGHGQTPDEAILDYSELLSGEFIVFNPYSQDRVEFTVPVLEF